MRPPAGLRGGPVPSHRHLPWLLRGGQSYQWRRQVLQGYCNWLWLPIGLLFQLRPPQPLRTTCARVATLPPPWAAGSSRPCLRQSPASAPLHAPTVPWCLAVIVQSWTCSKPQLRRWSKGTPSALTTCCTTTGQPSLTKVLEKAFFLSSFISIMREAAPQALGSFNLRADLDSLLEEVRPPRASAFSSPVLRGPATLCWALEKHALHAGGVLLGRLMPGCTQLGHKTTCPCQHPLPFCTGVGAPAPRASLDLLRPPCRRWHQLPMWACHCAGWPRQGLPLCMRQQ